MVIFIVAVSFIVMAVHILISNIGKKYTYDINVQSIIQGIIDREKLGVVMCIKDRIKASYNCEDKVISFSKGSTAKNVAEAFHELGHAIDDKGVIHKKFGILQYLLFYFLKYSIPLAIFLYILEQQMAMNNLIIPTFIFIAAGIIFFFGTLIDEVKATKYAIREIKTNLTLEAKDMKIINLSLFGGLLSYITLCLFTVVLLVGQIIYVIG